MIQFLHTENYQWLLTQPDNSFDSIVTDSPYGLGKEPDAMKLLQDWLDHGYHEVKGGGFMGKKWDSFVPQPRFWKECLRVLKPGGYCLSFFGTRTYDWGVMAIRLAGFEIRDQIAWVYGSGFPKSMDVSKAIDKVGGAEWIKKQWSGWGTALKPAMEPIVVARKPLIGTVVQNIEAHGTGAINIDDCRVDGGARPLREVADMRDNVEYNGNSLAGRVDGTLKSSKAMGETTLGRWPANLIHDGSDEVMAVFPDSKGQQGAIRGTEPSRTGDENANCYGKYSGQRTISVPRIESETSAARFFYCAKTSREERNRGLENFDKKPLNWSSGTQNPGSFQSEGTDKSAQNNHPTVKPIALMRYLVRLVTPKGGRVLDPFCGSGSTGIACKMEGFDFVGLDISEEYIMISKARADAWAVGLPAQPQLGLFSDK